MIYSKYILLNLPCTTTLMMCFSQIVPASSYRRKHSVLIILSSSLKTVIWFYRVYTIQYIKHRYGTDIRSQTLMCKWRHLHACVILFLFSSTDNLCVFVCGQDGGPWKGELCGEGSTLLEYYATQNDISPFLQDLAWVSVYTVYTDYKNKK